MIPGFVIDPIQYRNFRFARSGDKELRATFSGKLLILHDHRNLFAVDHQQGKVRWSIPIGGDRKNLPRAEQPIFRQLSERIRGCLVTDDRVYVTSSHRQVYCFGHDGVEVWRKELKFDPAQATPAFDGNEVFVLNQRDLGYGALSIKDGALRKGLELPLAYDSARKVGDPVQLGKGLCLLPLTSAVLLLDLSHRTVLWAYEPTEGTIEQISHSSEAPDEVIAVLAREKGTPALVGVSIATGKREWRYEKFEAGPAFFSIFRDGHQLFVIHGSDRLKLLALEVRRIPGAREMNVSSLWPQKEIHLGTYLGRMRSRRLHILENAIIFPDPGQTISIYDRVKGTLLRAVEPNPLSSFLTEKRSYRSSVAAGHLVLLTDGGGCGMAGAGLSEQSSSARNRMRLLSAYLEDKTKPGAVIELALAYFQAGDHPSAVALLDRALKSEAILSSDDAKGREDIAYLLEGIKQEAMKHINPREITARQLKLPPVIDGRLEDSWSYAHRVLLTSPRNLNLIPAPGLSRQWEGEEDLSAILYTGWDDSYFYFALDVEDDILRAYDRDAENWKGDCLLIGLDPDGDGGYRQGSDDQLMTLGLTIPKRRKEAKGEAPEEGEEGEGLEEEREAEDDDEPQGLFSVKKKPDSSGAIYEVALPWTSFPLFKNGTPPSAGFNFGLSLLLTDDDTGRGATKTLSINPCHLIPRKQRNVWIWRFMIPEFFPRVKLR
jgi:tetratricopeptide (TPR) repeat protein